MLCLTALAASLCLPSSGTPPQEAEAAHNPRSVHSRQTADVHAEQPEEDLAEARALASTTPAPRSSARTQAATQGIDDDFIVFGYLQSENQVFHQRWHALTHVGSRFVGFDSLGRLTNESAFTGRSPYLKAGGAAEAAGVKVVLVLVSFSDGNGGTIAQVMTSPARRATLVAELVQVLAADSYSHGVSLDLEFSWGPAVRDGITAFTHELRAGLDTLGPGYELSIYTNAIHSSNQWDFDAQTGITPAIDYMLYSMYDWASGSRPHAISDLDNCLQSFGMRAYLDQGLPPEKLVPVISAYSRRWSGVSTYDATGSGALSSGFTDALYDVTLNPSIGSPAWNYVRGDEAGWYTWNDGTPRVRTFDDPEAMEIEVRHALSFRDSSGAWNGRRLGGVGFWSLMWMAESTSIDPRTGAQVGRTRTYPHVYQLVHDAFASPGTSRRTLETFAGLDFRWRDPNEAADTTGDVDGDSTRSLVPDPLGDGNAMRLAFDVEGATGNRVVLAHEVLASPIAPAVPDTNAFLGHVPRTSRLSARLHVASATPGYSIRMLVVDAEGEVEASPPLSLGAAGAHTLRWNLSDPAGVTAFASSEPAFASGDGVLESTPGAADIGVYGFVVEGEGPASGVVLIRDVAYHRASPDGRRYRINEFRYSDPASEFVEIEGPAGPLPIGLALRSYSAADGSIARSFPLFGSIADEGNGRGYLVIGDPSTPNVDASASFSASTDDLSNSDPSALQIFDSANGYAHDSVVYEAYGGLEDLVRSQAEGVTGNGWPWLGEAASGRAENGMRYTLGRDATSRDTRRNAADFSFQVATPGARNATKLALPFTADFEAPVPEALQTFDAVRRRDPVAAGLPASPNGGLAWRCVDAAGGGVIGAIGGAELGRSQGFLVSGQVYVPSATEPAAAVAIGIAGSQGSTFFSSTAEDRSGYESGVWLIRENQAGVGLADGRPDHPQRWELVLASHDNQDEERTSLLASAFDGSLAVTPGTWATFQFELRPFAGPSGELTVTIGGTELYRGPLPASAPRSGAFQVGFRENHAGAPIASEGAWIDGLRIAPLGPVRDRSAVPR